MLYSSIKYCEILECREGIFEFPEWKLTRPQEQQVLGTIDHHGCDLLQKQLNPWTACQLYIAYADDLQLLSFSPMIQYWHCVSSAC